MSDDADKQLSTFVNYLGVIVFGLLVVYHYVTSTVADASN